LKKKEKKKKKSIFNLFGKKDDDKKKKEVGKNVYELSDSEDEGEDPPEFIPQLHYLVNKNFADEAFFQLLATTLKSNERKEKKNMSSLSEEFESVIINPIFGVREFGRQSQYWRKLQLDTLKQVDEEINNYKNNFISPITLKSISMDETTVVDEDSVLGSNQGSKKVNWLY